MSRRPWTAEFFGPDLVAAVRAEREDGAFACDGCDAVISDDVLGVDAGTEWRMEYSPAIDGVEPFVLCERCRRHDVVD